MKKRLFSILTALTLCLTLLPTAALAEETPATAAQPSAAEVTGVSQTGETPQPDAAVSALQSRLDALPTADSLASADEAEIAAAYQAAQDAYDALEALGPDQLAQITGLEKLAALMDWFNGQVTPLDSEPVKLSYKTSGGATAATETFSNLMAALSKVETLTNASDIVITVSDPRCWSDNSASGQAGGSYTFPTGTYTITFEKDKINPALFYFRNKDVNTGFDLVIPAGADVTLKSDSKSIVHLFCNSVTVKGTLSLNYTYIQYSKCDVATGFAPVVIDGGKVELLENGGSYGDVTLKNKGSLTQQDSYAILNLMENQTPMPSLTVGDGTVTVVHSSACIYRKVILDDPQAKLELKSGCCGSDKRSDDSIACSAGQLIVSGATVKSNVTISDSGYASISGGSFSGSVTLSGTADHNTTVSGGAFTKLVTLNSAGNIQLSGGTFDQGLTSGQSLSASLSPGHAFKKGDTLVPYSTVNTTTTTSATTWPNSGAVTVVECSHSGFESGRCDYCNATIAARVTSEAGATAYYDSLNAAVNAITSGSTLKPLAAINTLNSLTVSTSFTLDLSAQQMTVGHLTVNENAELTVQGSNPFAVSSSEGGDGKAEINGTLKLSSGADLSAVDITVNSSGEMTVSGSAVIGGKVDSSGTMTVFGGTFSDAVNIKGGTATISGGTFQETFTASFEPNREPTVSVSGGVFENGVNAPLSKVLLEGYGFRKPSTPAEWFGYEDDQSLISGKVEAKPLPIKSVTLSCSPENPTVFSQVTLTAACVLDDAYSGQTPTFAWTVNSGASIGSQQSVAVTPQECTESRYYCTVTLDGYSEKKAIHFTAGQAAIPDGPDGYVTAPAAATDLIYNGETQQLLSAAGSFDTSKLAASDYQMWYRLEGSTIWKTDFSSISASEAGTYKVYYAVWSTDPGTSSYKNYTSPTPLTVTISKATVTITAADKNEYAGSNRPNLSSPVLGTDYTLSGLVGDDALESGVTIALNCNADMSKVGEYAITPVVTGTDSRYDFVCVSGKLTVSGYPSSSKPTYAATAAETVNGTVTMTPRRAGRGDTVTITVKPDVGYILEAITALDQNGKSVELTDKGDGKFTFKMPASKVTVTAAFAEEHSMLSFFTDVTADKYYYDAVLWAAKNGITGGVDETHFAPDAACTRAQIVTFLYRWAVALGVDVSAGEDTNILSYNDAFDIPEYAIPAFQWAVSMGIIQGNGGSLMSNQSCTRAQTVTFLYRFAAALGLDVSVGEDTNILSYADALDIPEYAIPAFQWAVGAGIIQGSNGNLMSGQTCTRAQIVTILYRSAQ